VVEVVQHGDQRPPLGVQLRAQVEQLDLMSDVEEGGGLVEQQQRRGLGQRHREPDALALPARQLVHEPVGERVDGGLLQGRSTSSARSACRTCSSA
jgi:hypothetical protein